MNERPTIVRTETVDDNPGFMMIHYSDGTSIIGVDPAYNPFEDDTPIEGCGLEPEICDSCQ